MDGWMDASKRMIPKDDSSDRLERLSEIQVGQVWKVGFLLFFFNSAGISVYPISAREIPYDIYTHPSLCSNCIIPNHHYTIFSFD